MWNDRGKWLVVTSSCPFTLQVAERGSWQAVVITCKTCLPQSMIRAIISGWTMLVIRMLCGRRPDVYALWVSFGLPWGSPDRRSASMCTFREIRMRAIRMITRATCHCEIRATCSWREGSLQPAAQPAYSSFFFHYLWLSLSLHFQNT